MDNNDQEYMISYERENNSSYMVLRKEDFNDEDYQIKMVRLNKPSHFLKFTINEVNERKCIYYDITSKQQMSRVYEFGKMTIEDIKSIFVNISEMVRIVDSYMLDLDKVIMEPQYIYMTMVDKKLYFAYCPGKSNSDFYEKMRSLFEYIMERFDHSVDKSCIVKLYDIYQKILVRDYDPYNLIWLFREPLSRGGKPDDKPDDKPENIINKAEEINKPEEIYKERSIDNKDDRDRDVIIPTVMTETLVEDEDENRTGPSRKTIVNCISLLLIITGIISLFLKQYAVIRIGVIPSVLCIIVGVLISVFKDFFTGKEVKREKKVEIPYKIPQPKIKYSYDKDENIKPYMPQILAEAVADETMEKSAQQYDRECNKTMLLSDYVRKLKADKFSLKPLDFESVNIRVKDNSGIDIGRDSVIKVNKFPCIIGSMKEICDLCIKEPVISKMHACISVKNGEYCIEDMNSTNCTYLNESVVENHKQYTLNNGDVIRIADKSFSVEIS
ncbi:MAG: DUF6382 domain-containing protein [Eubacteriales bacterium]|nr:DUF6382 domain-containing protein [Eubacteriales bacterium]